MEERIFATAHAHTGCSSSPLGHQSRWLGQRSSSLRIWSDVLFFFLIYFIYSLLAALGLHCGARASHCGGFSCCMQSTGSRRAAPSSSGMWAQQLWFTGSRAQAQQLWCTGLTAPACGIFLDQGSNLCSLHWQADPQPLHHQGSPWSDVLRKEYFSACVRHGAGSGNSPILPP